MFSFAGDTIVDPFLGSGTTTLAAKNLGRHSIGYEINEDFQQVIGEKLYSKTGSMSPEVDMVITPRRNHRINFGAERDKLPYIFKDPVGFDKKSDPRLKSFGSKINKV